MADYTDITDLRVAYKAVIDETLMEDLRDNIIALYENRRHVRWLDGAAITYVDNSYTYNSNMASAAMKENQEWLIWGCLFVTTTVAAGFRFRFTDVGGSIGTLDKPMSYVAYDNAGISEAGQFPLLTGEAITYAAAATAAPLYFAGIAISGAGGSGELRLECGQENTHVDVTQIRQNSFFTMQQFDDL